MRRIILSAMLGLIVISAAASAGTVAYWRFEEGTSGVNIQHPVAAGVWNPDTPDSSGNGHHLSTWDSGQWQFRANTAYATVPLYGVANNLSIKNTSGSPTLWNESLASWEPAQWTIEATFKAEAGGWKTIVGRDSQGALTQGTELNQALAGIYLQTTDSPTMGLAIKFIDRDGYWHAAESAANAYVGFNFGSDPDGNNAPWYTIAATSDGRFLRLYLLNHNQPQNGYVKIAETDMTVTNPGSTDTSLDGGAGDGGDWNPGNITVGRGMYNGGHGDRFYGYLDEVRLSDRALTPDEFLVSPAYLMTVAPAQDEYLPSTAATTYQWTTDTDLLTANNVQFDRYSLYVTGSLTDMGGETPSTWLHAADITDVSAQNYSGYAGTYDYNEDYYWRIDMVAMDPNDADPNNIVYDIPHVYPGLPIRFFGPRACPSVAISGNVAIMPDQITQVYTVQNAVFTATITRGAVDVDAIQWFKVAGVKDDAANPDPNDVPDIAISNVPGVTEIAYNPDLATATSTTLTIVAAEVADNGDYYAYVRLVDPLGGATGCWATSAAANLFVRDDTHAGTNYLVHRYGFDGDVTDSIGGAHGVVADLATPNHTFADGQVQLTNTGLSSGPRQDVQIPDPANPGQTITRQQLLDQPGAYVDLPNGIVSALGRSATFMVWFTYNSADTGGWPRLLDLGTSTGGEGFSTGGDGVEWINGVPYANNSAPDTQEYVMLSPKRDGGPGWRYETVVRPGNPVSALVDPTNNASIAGGQEACIACVFDGASGTIAVYVNGAFVGQRTGVNQDLSNINDVNNWLGRSQWNDSMFSGKINEFRIYDIPLNAAWIKAYYDQGADDYTTTPNPCVYGGNAMDFDGDCAVNLDDFAEFAAQWLYCGNLYGCN